MSMPEEVNRVVTDHLSAMLLTPVDGAGDNLRGEGLDDSRIHFVGNIMAESVLRNLPRIDGRHVPAADAVGGHEYVLATIHRPENTDQPEHLRDIASALMASPLPVLFPIHPRTRALLGEIELEHAGSQVRLVEPVGYLDMLALQSAAAAIVTDSGGVQEEACMLGTPCVTVRRNTERGITVELGANRLVPASQEQITMALSDALKDRATWETPDRWDAAVSERVIGALARGVTPMSGC
jgi:UDP-N-acetylglucosamine 2-epimerase (non-hydrolysing)